jgi:hypothetical protein
MVELFMVAFPALFGSIFYPPLVAVMFLFLCVSEAYGPGNLILQFAPHAPRILSGAFTLGGVVAFLRLRKECKKYRGQSRLLLIGWVIILAMTWGIISTIWVGTGILGVLREFPNSTMLGVIYAIAYRNDLFARKLFVFTIALQLIIGTATTLWPEGVFGVLTGKAHLAVEDYNMLIFASEGSRLSGQFLNSIQLGYYGAIGFIIGSYMFFSSRVTFQRNIGIMLVLMSLWVGYITSVRSILVGLFWGIYILVIRLKVRPRFVVISVLIPLMLLCGLAVLSYVYTHETMSLIPDIFSRTIRDEFSIDSYRYQAILNTIPIINTKPIFGLGTFDEVLDKASSYMAHQAPLYIAALYGIPSGLCVLLLMWWGLAANFRVHDLQENPWYFKWKIPSMKNVINYNIAIMFGWVTFFLMMTNGMAGKTIAWIALGIACLQWAHPSSQYLYSIGIPLPFKR